MHFLIVVVVRSQSTSQNMSFVLFGKWQLGLSLILARCYDSCVQASIAAILIYRLIDSVHRTMRFRWYGKGKVYSTIFSGLFWLLTYGSYVVHLDFIYGSFRLQNLVYLSFISCSFGLYIWFIWTSYLVHLDFIYGSFGLHIWFIWTLFVETENNVVFWGTVIVAQHVMFNLTQRAQPPRSVAFVNLVLQFSHILLFNYTYLSYLLVTFEIC